MFHGSSVDGDMLSPSARVIGTITQFQVLSVRIRVCRAGGALARWLFAQSRPYVIYRLKERGAVVQSAEEIGVGIRTHDRAADDATSRSDGSQRRDAIYGERRPTDELAEYEYREGANDASGNRVVTLWAGKEVYGGVKVVLGYETVFEFWTEKLLCARTGIEG